MFDSGRKLIKLSLLFSGIILSTCADISMPIFSSSYYKLNHTMTSEEFPQKKKSIKITDLTTSQLAKAIREGKLSSTRCVKAFLKRIDNLNNGSCVNLNAFITVDHENALSAAYKADLILQSHNQSDLPPLFGVPIALKDSLNTKGLRTTGGTPSLQYNIPFIDSMIVERVRQAGAIIIGKTNLHELSLGITNINFAFGPVRNPYNLQMFSGGSSGGCAAAVAAHLVSASISDDVVGDTRIPASLCGVVGFRPSTGRYPISGGILPIAHTLGTPGIMARTVSDIDILDKALTLDFNRKTVKPKEAKAIRLGIPQKFYENLDYETHRVVQEALWKLHESGIELIETENIDDIDLEECGIAVEFIRKFEYHHDLQYYLTTSLTTLTNADVTNQIMSPDVSINSILEDNNVSLIDYLKVLENYLPILQYQYKKYFSDNSLDGILYPTTKLPTRSIALSVFAVELNGEQIPTSFAYSEFVNLAPLVGSPAISIPVGLTQSGLPVGMELNGLPNKDIDLLRTALTIQNTMDQIPSPEFNPSIQK